MFYSNSNRYDGMWLDDHPHGEGRMIYTNGDVYEGKWKKGPGDTNFENIVPDGNGKYIFSNKEQKLGTFFIYLETLIYIRCSI